MQQKQTGKRLGASTEHRQAGGGAGEISAKRNAYLGFLALGGLAAACIVTFFFCPRFVYWLGLDITPAWVNPEVNRAIWTLKQIADPFAPIDNPSNWVIAWRLLLPLTWHYLHLPTWLFLIFPHIGCVVALGLSIHLVYQQRPDRLRAFLAAVALGACPWFFVATGWLTYFDSWVIIGLLVATFESPVAMVVACVLVPWIDERFLLALPVCVIMRAIDPATGRLRDRRELIREVGFVAVACLPYPILRLVAAWHGHGGHATEYLSTYANAGRLEAVEWTTYVAAIWSGMRAGWFFVGAVFWLLWKLKRRKLCIALLVVMLAAIGTGAVLAADIGRSTSMTAAPIAMMGVVLLASQKPDLFRVAVPVIAIANLLLPASNVISVKTWPIRYFYAEWDEWRQPPAILDYHAYLNAGTEFQKEGKFDEAKRGFDLAIQLSPDNATPWVTRAGLEFERGELEATEKDLQQAMQLNAKDPEIYFAYGSLRVRRGDIRGAVMDLQSALSMAPADWDKRAKVEAILKTLQPEAATVPAARQ